MDKMYSIFIDSDKKYELLKDELLKIGCCNYLISNGKKYNAPEKLFFYNSNIKERRDVFDEINEILIEHEIDAKVVIMQTEGRLWYGLELSKDE
ncbi:hypothetical protein [Haemophilus parainfluenzae]|nr:hypothetical protein [Haemophilus parainfluenzae]MBS6285233.1 hypothetical protein [Haemophilus parainfluenzae]